MLSASSTYREVDEWLVAKGLLIRLGMDFNHILDEVDLSLTGGWVAWMEREGKPCDWDSFKEYLTQYHYPRKSRRKLGFELATLSNDQSVNTFNADFLYLVGALDMKQDLVLVGLYKAMIPARYRFQVTLLPEDTPLMDVLDHVALDVNTSIFAQHRDVMWSKDTEYKEFWPQVSNSLPRGRRRRGKRGGAN